MTATGERSTRERILEVAEDFLGEHGYHGTRLHHIAQRVGIQKASLFHYFPTKDHLYRAVVEQGLGETQQTVTRVLESEGAPLDKISALLEAYVELVASHPARTKLLLRQSLGDAPDAYRDGIEPQRVLNYVVNFIAEGQRLHLLAPIDPRALVLGIVGMVAFFFTSAPALSPAWCGDPRSSASIGRVKEHVIQVVRRCLQVDEQAHSDSSTQRAIA